LNDTAILMPVGNTPSASYQSSFVNFGLINNDVEDDTAKGDALSLGPGGFITMRLPAPIVDKTGYDLFVKEVGDSIEGYMVFAGIDADPTDPYVKKGSTGSINWVNISSCGVSNSNLGTLAHQSANTELSSNTDKFYGSGYFDFSKCTPTITMAKYIRIIDDNEESAFVSNDKNTYYKVMMYGEASTATAGADIDAVKVLNHVKLINP